MDDGPWLTDVEQLLWLNFVRTWTLLSEQLDRSLKAEAGLSLAEYEVLALLVAGPRIGLRMSELMDRALVSKTRLTHIVDRLETVGLVRRFRADEDGRGVRASITAKGRRLQRRAAVGHVEAVRHLLVDHLPPRLQPALTEALQSSRAALGDTISLPIARPPLGSEAG